MTPGRSPRSGVPRARARPRDPGLPGEPRIQGPPDRAPGDPRRTPFWRTSENRPIPPKSAGFRETAKIGLSPAESVHIIGGLGRVLAIQREIGGFVGNPLSWPENRQNGGPGRPGPGTLENPKKCTFCWVFNNSPSRDKIRTRFFGFCAQKFVTP